MPLREEGQLRYGVAMLRLSNVTKRYGSIHALTDISFRVAPGEIVAVVGENGAGKSTLVRCIAAAMTPDSGEIALDDVDLGRTPKAAIRQGVSVVWQDLALCENLDVTANMFLGHELSRGAGLRQAAMHSQASKAFAELDVDMFGLDRPIERLSGGQRQIVAIARAMLDTPKVLVLDEPTAALGVTESRTIVNVIRTLQSRGVACILVSHQLEEVFELADRIVVLRHGHQVADLHRTETHQDDVVALITGVDVDSTAGQQLRRLHSLAEQLADADQSSILPLTVSSLANALGSERLAIYHSVEGLHGEELTCSASLHLPPLLAKGLTEIPVGEPGGFVGIAAAMQKLQVVQQLRDLPRDHLAHLAVQAGMAGAWAAPIVGQRGTLAIIVGFTDGAAQLRPEQIQLLDLFSTMAGGAMERGELVETLRTRNQSLEGLRGVLETLAGPDLVQAGMGPALDALRDGVKGDLAMLFVQPDVQAAHSETVPMAWEQRALSSGLGPTETVAAVGSILKVVGSGQESPDISCTPIEWSRGTALLVCFWIQGEIPDGVSQLLDGAANSFRLALERELTIDAEQEAAALHKSRAFERDIVRRLGHELRTPLTAIQGFSSSLLQPGVTWSEDQKTRFLRIIEAEAGRMGRLVAQLFDDSAIEAGTLRLDLDYCDLVAIIERSISVAAPDSDVGVLLPDSLTILADADRLQQVFVNLVGNAIRHTDEGTAVTVAIDQSEPQSVCIAVEDNGHGLPIEVANYLNDLSEELAFDRGLGLRVTRGFVRAHGGSIRAIAGRGTRIEIMLPVESDKS